MGLTRSLALSCAAHPWRTLAGWGLAVVAAVALALTSLHGLTTDTHVTGSPEYARAAAAIARAFPPGPADLHKRTSDLVVVSSTRYAVDAPQFRTFVARLVADGRATGRILSGTSYLESPEPSLVSRDRHATLIPILVASDSAIVPVEAVVARADATPGFSVSITGDHAVGHDFNSLSQRDLEHGELAIGMPAALAVLLLVFGSLVAGLVPLLLAIVSIAVALGLVTLLSLEVQLSVFVVNMLTGMGLALGIDYSLFLVSRFREERARGVGKEQAIATVGATASRAVLFSGSTFVIALFGMLLVPTTIMRSLAAGAILVGVVSVVAALTLLPALLSLLGDRVNALRVPLIGRSVGLSGGRESRLWHAIVARVIRRPAVSLVLVCTPMIAAAVAILGLHIGASGVSTLPDGAPSKQGYLALERHFPTTGTDPVNIVAEGGDAARVRADLVSLRARLAADPRFGTGTISTSASGDVAVLAVPVRGDAVGPEAVAAVRDLRAHVLPDALASTGARVLVGGKTAGNIDYFDASTSPAPYVFLLVLGLSLVLLTVAFRSLAIALVSILLNLISVGAAYGLLVLVFQHGYGAGLLGFRHVPTIDAWVPLFLFSVLFGLSMDYQVFLLSRIKERYDRTRSNRDAVLTGVSSTARIITGAALIIVAVFAGFASGQLVMFQEMGFGIAVALLLDATLIRSVVLPGLMALLGDRSWYLPGWLRWLPRLEAEGSEGEQAP